MFGLAPLQRSGSAMDGGMYSADVSVRVYAQVAQMTRTILSQGISVIVDATNTKKQSRDEFRSIAHDLHANFVLVACVASAEVLRERVRVRRLLGRDASEASVEVLAAQMARAEPIGSDEGAFTLDTSKGLTEQDVVAFAQTLTTQHQQKN